MATTFTSFGDIPVPDDDAATDIAAIVSALAEVVDPKLRGVAFSTTERDSKFYLAPAGFVCTVVYPPSPTEPTTPDELIGMYIKTVKAGQIGWSPIYEPTAAYTETVLQLVDGYEQRGVSYTPVVTRENANYANLNGAIVRSDAGNIANNSVVAYLPANLLPARAGMDVPVATNSNSTSTFLCPKLSISADGTMTMFGPGNTTWLSFDNIRYRLA